MWSVLVLGIILACFRLNAIKIDNLIFRFRIQLSFSHLGFQSVWVLWILRRLLSYMIDLREAIFLTFVCDWRDWSLWLYLFFKYFEWPLHFGFLNSMKPIYGSFIFFHLPLKIQCLTIDAFERESQLAVAFDPALGGSAVSRESSNVTAFWGTFKFLKCEFRLLFVFLKVSRPIKLRRLHYKRYFYF